MVMRICFLLENCYVSTYKLKLIFDYLRAITLFLKKITSRVKNKKQTAAVSLSMQLSRQKFRAFKRCWWKMRRKFSDFRLTPIVWGMLKKQLKC